MTKKKRSPVDGPGKRDVPPGARLTQNLAPRDGQEELHVAALAFESQEGMVITDPRGRILRVNRAFTRLTGYSAGEAIGGKPSLLRSGRQDRAFYRRMLRTLLAEKYWQGEVWNRRKNGELYAEWLTISAVAAETGPITHYVGAFSDITKDKEEDARIHRMAYCDPLTNLPNRRLLKDRIGQALAGSSRSGRYGAVVFLDLDNFKTLNDTHGHDVGDKFLIEMARRIQVILRGGDTVARLGGDEFVLMVQDLSTVATEAVAQISLLGEKIRAAIAQPFAIGDHQFGCTASLGIALCRGHEDSVETLLTHADAAMYEAKRAGRDGLRCFDPAMQITLDERSAVETELRQAVDGGQLHLHYQPQIDKSGHVIGVEALLRWMHPSRGLVLPDDFMPLAEETGLIAPIGQWVLDAACAQIKAWSKDAKTRALRISVNVSPNQFRQPGFVAQIKRALNQSSADPTRLKIELSERLLSDDAPQTIACLTAIKALGVELAMDNLAAGMVSSSHLRRLPLDQLKIDQACVRGIVSNPDDAAIARTIITLGKTLGVDVIAEGVETESQTVQLLEMGCAAYQGDLFAGPLPLAAFETYLRQGGNCSPGLPPSSGPCLPA
jgi:diguanylate cyclase (GGDEF)-like protein/PAS domain S-box-containing protein